MGRQRKSADAKQGHISKAERERRAKLESAARGQDDKLKCPAWLVNKDAKAEYSRVVKELTAVNLIGNLDSGALAIYSQTFADYLAVTRQLNAKEYETPLEQDRLIKNQNKYIEVILKFAQRFGLTIGDRLKLATAPEEPEDDEFSDL